MLWACGLEVVVTLDEVCNPFSVEGGSVAGYPWQDSAGISLNVCVLTRMELRAETLGTRMFRSSTDSPFTVVDLLLNFFSQRKLVITSERWVIEPGEKLRCLPQNAEKP